MEKKKKYVAPKATVYEPTSQHAKRARAPRGAPAPSFKGTVASMVSIILVIGMIGTLFFAYDNSMMFSDEFLYFSPSVFLSNLSEQSITIEGGVYYADVLSIGYSGLEGFWWHKAYITIDGRRIVSDNTLDILADITNRNFIFTINGVSYSTEWCEYPENYDGIRHPVLSACRLVLPDVTYTFNEYPNRSDVVLLWKSVSDFKTFGNALGGTVDYIGDVITYLISFCNNALPWNSVSKGNRDYLENLWSSSNWVSS